MAIEIKKGTVLVNNDPRANGATVTVTEVVGGFALYLARTRKAKIALHRIHTDGKTRASGYSVKQ